MVEREPQAEAVRLLVLLRAMLRRVAGPTPQNRNASALHALRRLSTIASALSHHKELFPDDVSTRGDVDACSRASRANIKYIIVINNIKFIKIILLYMLSNFIVST